MTDKLAVVHKATLAHLHGWWVHEVKGEEVIDAHGLEREDCLGEIGPLNLGDGRG